MCGKIIGYQIGTVDAFSTRHTRGLDGVKLSHRNPPENIWMFIAAFAENYKTGHKDSLCPCINRSDSMIPASPTGVGSDYFCDTGARNIDVLLEFFLKMIPCGMELAVKDQALAAVSTILHGSTES